MSNIRTASFSDLPSTHVSIDDHAVRQVCIANISPRERKKRLKVAISQFIVTLVILGVLIALDLNPLWRLPLLFMFSASTVSYFQVLDKTWVSLAARGARKFGEQEEKIEDQAELQQVRRQARRVILKGFLVAIPLTLLAYLLPF